MRNREGLKTLEPSLRTGSWPLRALGVYPGAEVF